MRATWIAMVCCAFGAVGCNEAEPDERPATSDAPFQDEDAQPGCGTAEPDSGTSEDTTTAPDSAVAPDTGWTEPADSAEVPDTGWTEPADSVEVPDTGWTEPADSVEDPDTGWTEPTDTVEAPDTGWTEPTDAAEVPDTGWTTLNDGCSGPPDDVVVVDPCDVPGDVPCDDGEVCTSDTCVPGFGCIHTPIVCSDANACTIDACVPGVGCSFDARSCDDGQACSVDRCDPQNGCLHEAAACEDHDACTMDSCDDATGACVFVPLDCDDDNACTTDACDASSGTCTHTDVACDDDDACTTDTCDPTSGCVNVGECPPVDVDPLAALSDDFDDAASLSDWHILSSVLGVPAQHDRIDIDTTLDGALVIDPNTYSAPFLPNDSGPGWFEDHKGPFLYKVLTGDFVIVAHVRMGTTTSMNAAPSGLFNSGGFVVRDPIGDDLANPASIGDERWVMYNIGYQQAFFGSETKTTFPDGVGGRPGPYSDSSLFLTPVTGRSARLALCRIGSHFYFFHDMDAAPGWQAETHTPSNVVVNNAWLPPSNYESGFDRPDIAAQVQVGFLVNRAFEGAAPPRLAVDWVTFATPRSLADCTPD